MDTPCSEKTEVEHARADSTEKSSVVLDKSQDGGHDFLPPSLHDYEADTIEDDYPDGGRGWLVVLGCVIICAVTVGWGYVFDRLTS